MELDGRAGRSPPFVPGPRWVASAREVDLLIDREHRSHPVEVKETASPSRTSANAFRVLERLGRHLGEGAVLCLKETDVPLAQGVTAVPTWYL